MLSKWLASKNWLAWLIIRCLLILIDKRKKKEKRQENYIEIKRKNEIKKGWMREKDRKKSERDREKRGREGGR